MKKSKLIMNSLLLCCLIFTGGSWIVSAKASTPAVQQELKELIEQRQTAVNESNEELFVNTLDLKNVRFAKEQKNWFNDAIQSIDKGSYHLSIEKWGRSQKGAQEIFLKQMYSMKGKIHSLSYLERFVWTQAGWKDSDTPFITMKGDHLVIKYTAVDLEPLAKEALNSVEKGISFFNKRYGWQPNTMLEVKLYDNPEQFRQSIKLSLPQWAVGWNEYGESIKFIGSKKWDKTIFASGLLHETTHQMLGDMTNDNASYWMQEGLATYYEQYFYPHLRLFPDQSDKPTWTISEMSKINLEGLSDKKAYQYYEQANSIVAFIISKYGEQKINLIMNSLNKQPYLEGTTSEKLKTSNLRTEQAVSNALNISFVQFAQEWYNHRIKNDND